MPRYHTNHEDEEIDLDAELDRMLGEQEEEDPDENERRDPNDGDDPDRDAEGDAAPVTFANPFANTFLETKQLDREGQRTFYDMIKSYEEIKSRDDLHIVKCNSEEEHNTMREHHVKRRRVNMHEDEEPEYEYYVAPLYKIYEFGFAIKSMQKDPGNNSIEPIRQDLAGMKRTLDELQSSDKSTVEEAPVISVAAKFFYSSVVYDYAAGEGTKLLNAAAMSYLRKHPADFGTHGKHVMQANNSHAHAQIRTILSEKYTNLRNHLKDHLHLSLGVEDEKKKQSLHALALALFKSYEIPVTEKRLRRLALLRWCATKFHIRFPPEDSSAPARKRWPINTTFWQEASAAIIKLIKQSEASAAGKQKFTLFVDALLKKDKEKYGDYTFKETIEAGKAEKIIDEYVLQAYPNQTATATSSGSRAILGEVTNTTS
ncbi:hypothetical protein A4X06_0g6644 [Tilletia controversa]|uniref:Uncharacterized protein n=1 Tax=Tilletia controversa TaxID=13291 RepID=A0A8X7MND2_9BASI|nr:hypothetical protein A4X06_0g6644 [Tilletia controversa]